MYYKSMTVNKLATKVVFNPARSQGPKSARKHKNLQKIRQLVIFVGYLKPMIN